MNKLSIFIMALFVVAALFGGLLAPYHPKADVDTPLDGPSGRHLLGTDHVGRDILSQVMAGSRVSLTVGFSAGVVATALGVLVGLLAGYFGGILDKVLMRLVDLFLALPRLVLLILFAAYLGAGIWVVVVVFVFISWAFPARVVRAQVLVEKQRAYVTSARLSGANAFYILRKHIFPALLPLVIAISIMESSHAIIMEAGLSFLGLGDPVAISWGTILHDAFAYPALFLNHTWLWWALPPGICLALVLLSLALVSVSLEERIDPRLKGRRFA